MKAPWPILDSQDNNLILFRVRMVTQLLQYNTLVDEQSPDRIWLLLTETRLWLRGSAIGEARVMVVDSCVSSICVASLNASRLLVYLWAQGICYRHVTFSVDRYARDLERDLFGQHALMAGSFPMDQLDGICWLMHGCKLCTNHGIYCVRLRMRIW